MNLKKRILAALCTLALLLTLSPPPARAANDIIFIALNEWMPELSAATMPIYYYNTYYVPYVIFDTNYLNTHFGTSVDLGIRVATTGSTVTLYTKRRQLIYDLDAGTCTDKEGTNYKRAAVIGGTIYLPIFSVQNFFADDGLSYVQRGTEYGSLLRLTTPSVWLSDEMFAEAAALRMPQMIKDYNQGQTPSPSPTPTDTTAPSPSPSPSPHPGEEGVDKFGVNVSFAFRVTDSGNAALLLDRLARENLPALFLFAPASLADNEALVRRVVGAGHAVGLSIPGGPAEDAKALLSEGNRLLSLIAHTNTRTVAIENGDSATVIDLEAAGWSVWNSNVPVSPKSTAAAYSKSIMNIVDAKRAVARIQLDDSALSLATLTPLLSALRAEGYNLRLAVGSAVG